MGDAEKLILHLLDPKNVLNIDGLLVYLFFK